MWVQVPGLFDNPARRMGSGLSAIGPSGLAVKLPNNPPGRRNNSPRRLAGRCWIVCGRTTVAPIKNTKTSGEI